MGLPGIVIANYGIYIDGKENSVLGSRVKKLEGMGLSVNTDIENISIDAGTVSKLDVSYKNAVAELQVINPYENAASLSECLVCSFYTEDRSGVFQLNSEAACCGEENFDSLLNINVYEYTPEKLVYKHYVMPPFDFELSDPDDPKGKRILAVSGDSDLVLKFEDSVLTSFCYTYPNLLYGGLDDNVDAAVLENMDAAAIEEVAEIRNNILAELKAAFESTDMDIHIDDVSGEIVMDNNILFTKDSSELSEEGKAYIDQFMKIYASVLLSDQFYESVSEVRFEGHTDSSGEFGYNKELSQKRADAVLEYSLHSEKNELCDSEKERLEALATAMGYSCTNLVYDENGNEDQDASRRVVVKFFINM